MNNISPGLAEIQVGQYFAYLMPKLRTYNNYYKSRGKNSIQ